jgi:glycosyltransferase involved in cell wall biosynthesis
MTAPAKNVVHVTSWLSRQGGGIPPVVWALAHTMSRCGFNASVLGLNDQWVASDCIADGFEFAAVDVVGPKSFGYAPALSRQMAARLGNGGVVHSHGLWMYPGFAARRHALGHTCPLVVSPHGMLEPWALNNARWKKQLVARLFENSNLQHAACLHALCVAEAENFRRYGLKNPIAIIANGVDADEFQFQSENGALAGQFPGVNGRRCVLFLSRLHPKKGLDNLLRAWARLVHDFNDWCLLIAGGGQPSYEQELKNAVIDQGLEQSVLFLGPLYGASKRQALAAASVFALPSFSEGFSVAILEAAATGIPVLLTPECNFPELAGAGAGIEVAPEAASVEKGLRQLFELDEPERRKMGRLGLELVRKSYTWPVIGAQMCQVYEWLLGRAPKPACVRMV